MRAIECWRKVNPGNERVLPDHVHLSLWLMEERTRLTAEVAWHVEDKNKWQDTQAAHLREITRLTAEIERLTSERDRQYDQNAEQITRIAALEAENEKLRAALHEAADELDAYYRAEYPGDHPYSKERLANAMRQNPARIAITQENKND